MVSPLPRASRRPYHSSTTLKRSTVRSADESPVWVVSRREGEMATDRRRRRSQRGADVATTGRAPVVSCRRIHHDYANAAVAATLSAGVGGAPGGFAELEVRGVAEPAHDRRHGAQHPEPDQPPGGGRRVGPSRAAGRGTRRSSRTRSGGP